MDPKSKMLTLPRVVVTPHIASADENSRNGMSRLAAQNVIAALNGKRLPTCVNPEVYGDKPKLWIYMFWYKFKIYSLI